MPGQSVGRYDVGNSAEVGASTAPHPIRPKLKLAPEVMNYFNEFTGVTRWRLVDYRGLSNLRICIKHECPSYRASARARTPACARSLARASARSIKNHRDGRLNPERSGRPSVPGAVMFVK